MNSKQQEAFNAYRKKIKEQYKLGNATEHTYRPTLQALLEALFPSYSTTNEPRRVACGAPDYVIQKKQIPIGYIEAKDIGVNLSDIEKSEQLERYLSALDNLILTDYLEFRFYRQGVRVCTVKLGDGWKGVIDFPAGAEEQLLAELESFFSFQGQTIKSVSTLTKKMAQKAKSLANSVERLLENDEWHQSTLWGQYRAFRECLISDMTPSQFADMYAQTITYGLFAARINDETPENFTRSEARELIPRSNPFLLNLFESISGASLDTELVWIVDELVALFCAVDPQSIVSKLEEEATDQDAFVYFYELFLAEFDPDKRKSTGVYYTPKPVVRFIVSAVDTVLKDKLGIQDGLASTERTEITTDAPFANKKGKTAKVKRTTHRIQILDPACGTFAFPLAVIEKIAESFGNMKGAWSAYVDEELLPRLHGFEIMMAPYAIAHINCELALKRTGYERTGCAQKRSMKIYLTNSLEKPHDTVHTLFSMWLSDEVREADIVKTECPVFVVMGNPPYAGESQNNSEYIEATIEPYKKEPGSDLPLQEKNKRWINNDYVKFIRYAQTLIDKNGKGVVGYINPEAYLKAPTFRGMRWSLLSSFDHIYVLNLHGDSNQPEDAPKGISDENVFDIKVGVCINIFVKDGSRKNKPAEVHYAELWGTRKEKYEYLKANGLSDIAFTSFIPKAPYYYMVPKSSEVEDAWNNGFGLKELFPLGGIGITSKRDKVVYQFTKEELRCVISDFATLPEQEIRAKYNLNKDSGDFPLSYALKDVKTHGVDESFFVRINYRPFDDRWVYYTGPGKGFLARPAYDVEKHLLRDNLALVFSRGIPKDIAPGFVVDKPSDKRCWTRSGMQNGDYFSPLYVYTEYMGEILKEVNLSQDVASLIAERVGGTYKPDIEGHGEGLCISPLDIFDYSFAVLNSKRYRDTFRSFLESEYPRIPYPYEYESFRKLVSLGSEIRLAFLMKAPSRQGGASFPVGGDNIVGNVAHKDGKVFINKTQYFDNVSKQTFEQVVGGYQPASKWLKERKGRKLSFQDISRYLTIVDALAQVNELSEEIDAVCSSNGLC